MSHDDPIVIRTFLNKIEAEVACGALAAAGIDAMIRADDAGGLRPGLWMAGVELLVRLEDAEEAAAILRAA